MNPHPPTAKRHSTFSILFVCMGNICRSPTAHGVMRQMVETQGLAGAIHIDSAGTHNYHPGSPPDERSQEHAMRRGYALHDLRARQIRNSDFDAHDLIIVMDWDNLEEVKDRCPPAHLPKLRRLTEFCSVHHSDVVPDPYYGGAQGFERVLDLVEDGCAGLLLEAQGRLRP